MRVIFAIAAISVGFQTSTYGSEVIAWGDDRDGQTTPPTGNDFTAIAAGGDHSLALKSDGSIVGWGNNDSGQATPPPAGNNFIAVAAGDDFSLALKSDGSIVAWGDNTYGQTAPPAGNNFIAVTAGGYHSLALKSDGSIVGWGDNNSGQATPPAGNNFIAIAAGWWHSLALKSDGSIVAWGSNYFGQAAPPAGNNFISVAAGHQHSLALKIEVTDIPNLPWLWTDTGLDLGTHWYRIRVRDPRGLETMTTEPKNVVITGTPTPNPAQWEIAPQQNGVGSVRMVAALAMDPEGTSVQYYFNCPEIPTPTQPVNQWITGRDITVTGLVVGQTYTFSVRYPDADGLMTGYSPAVAVTIGVEDVDPPTPDPTTLVVEKWYLGGQWYHILTAGEVQDDSGVEYQFNCVDVPGLVAPTWYNALNTAGLYYPDGNPRVPNVIWVPVSGGIANHTYRVRTRDQSINQNTGQWSSEGGTVSVSLELKYYDFGNTPEITPAAYLKVELWEADAGGNKLLGTSYTDENGQVNFGSFENVDNGFLETGTRDLYFRIYADSGAAVVKTDFDIMTHYVDTATTYDVPNGLFSFPYTVPESNLNFNEAVFLACSIYDVREWFIENTDYTTPVPPKLTVWYPSVLTVDTAYNPGSLTTTKAIRVAAGYGNSGFKDRLAHEYGHYLQHWLYGWGQLLCSWLAHDLSSYLPSDAAFGEGWADFVGGAATDGSLGEYDLESFRYFQDADSPDEQVRGAGDHCEMTVAAALYDIYDDNQDVVFSGTPICPEIRESIHSLQRIVDVLRYDCPTTMNDFWTAYRQRYTAGPATWAIFDLQEMHHDSEAPTAPSGLTSSSHQIGQCTDNTVVNLSWNAASDDLSGIAGYVLVITNEQSKSLSGVMPNVWFDATSTTISMNGMEGKFWVHLAVVDRVGVKSYQNDWQYHWSQTIHYGPICIIASDINSDGFVDMEDFALFGAQWLRNDCIGPDWCGGTDIDMSGGVDLDDLSFMALHWLEGT